MLIPTENLSFAVIFFVVLVAIVTGLIGFGIGRLARFAWVKSERSDAIKRSESVILGSVYEKVLPFLPEFPYAPKDMVFIGKGFDYLVLDGLSAWELKKIVFLEVKSGTSRLNANEKAIAASVMAKKVEWREYRV